MNPTVFFFFFFTIPQAAGAVLPGESGDGVSVLDFTSWWWQTPEYFEVQVKDGDMGQDSDLLPP